MSVIRQNPKINQVIEGLTDAEKAKLLTEVNSGAPLTVKSLVNKDYFYEALDTNEYEIVGTLLQVAPAANIPGITIRTNHSDTVKEFFIGFDDKQRLQLYNLDTINKTIEEVNEPLDINELRRLLEDKEGTNVVANPTLTGTEAALSGLQVGETKYKVGGGGSEQHCYCISISVYLENSVNVAMRFNYYSDNNDITNKATFTQDLYDKGFTGSEYKRYYIYGNGDNQSSFQYNPKLFIAQYLAAEASTTLKMYFATMSYDTQNNVFVQSNNSTTVSSVDVKKVY